MQAPKITIITPTTGKGSLNRLIDSIENQTVPSVHILLWDDMREDSFFYPDSKTMRTLKPSSLESYSKNCQRYNVIMPGSFVQGNAYGSALRAVGLMAANTPYVTFADDDVWYEKDHLEALLYGLEKNNALWGFSVRKVWSSDGDYIGEDRFESVGDSPTRKVPYEMVDNNVMMFSRRFGASAACLYRETIDYNDDRLMYAFLKRHAGDPVVTGKATVNQTCPDRLEQMFRANCVCEK